MQIGEKIAGLRQKAGLSQEQLAEKLSVSRQSVSKWEMNQSLPQLDKVIQLCNLFNISTDALLKNTLSLPFQNTATKKNKYFGTDGFRGEAGASLTSMHAYKVGRFLGWYFGNSLSGCEKPGYRPRIVIGKDTRRSRFTPRRRKTSGIIPSSS